MNLSKPILKLVVIYFYEMTKRTTALENGNAVNRKRIKGENKPRLKEGEDVKIVEIFWNCKTNEISKDPLDLPLRVVLPYHFEFRTYCKGRWVGKTILEVSNEFIAYSEEYYKRVIENGRITVNEKPCSVDQILKDNDLIIHKAMCVENVAVAFPKIKVIGFTRDVVAIDKPCSLAIHPTGGYRYNTVMEMFRTSAVETNVEEDLSGVLNVHRLDRVTSGLVILARNSSTARKITELFTDSSEDLPGDITLENVKELLSKKTIRKTYLARVRGRFSSMDEFFVDGYMRCVDIRGGKHALVSTKESEKDRWSCTIFKPLFYDPENDETVVQCCPITGRTHQIRVHLQSVGHAISNDEFYGGSTLPDSHVFKMRSLPSSTVVIKALLQSGKLNDLDEHMLKDLECIREPLEAHTSVDNSHLSGIFLHALRYEIPSMGIDYETDRPGWAVKK